MRYVLRYLNPGWPVIACEGELKSLVSLEEWIRCTNKSPRLRELRHDGSVTAMFTGATGEAIEVAYGHGYIGAFHDADNVRVALLKELAQHLNELTQSA